MTQPWKRDFEDFKVEMKAHDEEMIQSVIENLINLNHNRVCRDPSKFT